MDLNLTRPLRRHEADLLREQIHQTGPTYYRLRVVNPEETDEHVKSTPTPAA